MLAAGLLERPRWLLPDELVVVFRHCPSSGALTKVAPVAFVCPLKVLGFGEGEQRELEDQMKLVKAKMPGLGSKGMPPGALWHLSLQAVTVGSDCPPLKCTFLWHGVVKISPTALPHS